MDGVFFRLAGRFAEDALKFEAALRQVEFQPQAAGELGELLELVRFGVGMHPPQERNVVLRQKRGDRLVGRQHELLDELVALVVDCQMGSLHLPGFTELDFDLGQVQLQPPRVNRRRRKSMASSSMSGEHRVTDSGRHSGAPFRLTSGPPWPVHR